MTEVLDLPLPLTRTDLYLAKAAGMAGITLPDEPLSREEQFLAVIAGDTSVELPAPANLTEIWLAFVAGIEPSPLPALEGAFWVGQQKVDVRYFAVAAGMVGVEAPAPQNRTEQYWARIAEVMPVHGVLKYATGTNIYLTDVVRGIDGLQFVYGDTAQQTYSGKNLLDMNAFLDYSSVTYTEDNGTYSITDFGSLVTNRYPLDLVSGKTYTLSVKKVAQGTSNPRIQVRKNDTVIGEVYAGTEVNPEKLTFTVDGSGFTLNATYSPPFTSPIIFSEVQLEESSSSTAYEPYVGGVPAPNPEYPQDVQTVAGEQTVEIVGKNLFDINSLSATGIAVENGVASGTAQAFNTAFGATGVSLSLEEAQYTLSITGYTDGNQSADPASGLGFRIGYTDGTFSSYTYWDNSNTTAVNKTFTTAANKTPSALLVSFASKGQNVWHLSKIQLERGSATPYEPYQGSGYTVNLGSTELCKIDTYQDYIYKSESDWYVHKECNKYTFTGNENFTRSGYTSSAAFVMYWSTAALDAAYLSDNGYCEFGEVRSYTNMNATSNGVIYNQFNSATSFVKMQKTMITNWDESATDAQKVTLAKAMIVGKSFYYVLTTPTDTKITDATLIAELNAIDSATLPKPDANITLTATSPNLPASIKISYYGEEE